MKRRPQPAAVAALAGLATITAVWPRAGLATALLCGSLLFAAARRLATAVVIAGAVLVLVVGPAAGTDHPRKSPTHLVEARHAR